MHRKLNRNVFAASGLLPLEKPVIQLGVLLTHVSVESFAKVAADKQRSVGRTLVHGSTSFVCWCQTTTFVSSGS